VLNADVQIQQKAAQMEEYAGSPRESMGIRTPGEKTAFEVSSLQTAASRIFQNKIDYFEAQFLEKILNAELEVAKRNLNASDIARSIDKDTGVVEFINISPKDIAVKGKVVPVGASHFARQNQLSQNLQALMQNISGDQLLASHFPTLKLADTWNQLLGFSGLDLIQPYGRVAEQAEAQRRTNAASQQVEAEDQTPLDDGAQEEIPEDVQLSPQQ
jgi:hypothetical protein